MNRLRQFSLFLLPALWLAVAPLLAAPAFATDAGWQQFRQRFITPEGRLVDTDQGSISHSEGQGYAMLLAVYYGDRATFEQLWHWTRNKLQIRGDNLLAWRWTPKDGVTDKNNASDGDLLVAWALLRAYNKWHAAEFLSASRAMAIDIRTKLVLQTDHGVILLPAAEGFAKRDGDAINLSYWVFPALDEIGQADPSAQWKALADNGIAILKYARFGRWGLPPDWLSLKTTSVPDDGISDRFSYNALRIPLYLLWSRRETPAMLKPYRDFWSYFNGASFLPAWTDLKDDCVDSYNASLGIRHLAQWVMDYPRMPAAIAGTPEKTEGYYSAALLLLIEMAMHERQAAGAR